MTLNIDVYRTIRTAGLRASSPATATLNAALAQLDTLDSRLAALNGVVDVDTNAISAAKAAASHARSSLNSAISHVATMADDALRLSGLATTADRLDELLDGPGQACASSLSMFGLTTGHADALIAAVSAAIAALSARVADYFAGHLSGPDLTGYLAAFGDQIAAATAPLLAKIQSELQAVDAVIAKVRDSALTQAIIQLWRDPCAHAVLESVLPADIKALLP